MAEELAQPQKLTFNQDGSIDLSVEGKLVRFVKEVDLLAVKGGVQNKEMAWETKKAQFNTQLAEANRLREETHQTLLKAQTERDNLKEQYKDYDTYKKKVGELETKLGSHKERLTKVEGALVERMRQSLIGAGASEVSLKDKTLDQLRSLEEAAKIFGREVKAKPANYDGGKQGGGNAPETSLDRAKRILEEHETQGRRIGSKNTKAKVG